MRISDWISDVCSSDLGAVDLGVRAVGVADDDWMAAVRCLADLDVERDLAEKIDAELGRLLARAAMAETRKSLVSGKSGSVRVALGGHLLIKQTQYIVISIDKHYVL